MIQFDEFGFYRRKVQGVKYGFPAEVTYYLGSSKLSIHSLTEHVSGGDYGAGYRHSYDWELLVPVYSGDWKTAEKKAIRHYREHTERRHEIEALRKKDKPDNILCRLIFVACADKPIDLIYGLRAGDFDEKSSLAMQEAIRIRLLYRQWEEAKEIAQKFSAEMPLNWKEDFFDDLMIEFIMNGCHASSEAIIKKMVGLDKTKTRKFLPDIAVEVSRGDPDEKPFIEFLERGNLLDKAHIHEWAKKTLLNMIQKWLRRMRDANDRTSYGLQHKYEAITLWREMGEWCHRYEISPEEANSIIVAYINDSNHLHPDDLEILNKVAQADHELIKTKGIEYLTREVSRDLYVRYPEYAEEALRILLQNPDEALLREEWLPLSFEQKQEVARALIKKLFVPGAEFYDYHLRNALEWNEKFELRVPELEELKKVMEKAQAARIEEEKQGDRRENPAVLTAALPALANLETNEKLLRFLEIMEDRAPSPFIRIRAGDLRRVLEYEMEKSFPCRPIVIDMISIFARAGSRNINMNPEDAVRIVEVWEKNEPIAAKDLVREVKELKNALCGHGEIPQIQRSVTALLGG